MKLPFLPSFKKQPITSYFLVLVLRNEKVNAVIFEEIAGKVKVIGEHQVYFSQSIENADIDEFLEVLDKAISAAESSLPENIQTQKTIFGIKEEWAQHNQIKKEYLVKLKRACEELQLTPIGFLVISQAISHLLQKEEGAPVSAILTEINKKSVTVSLIRGGKTIETKTSEIHESIPFTVDTLLKHFHTSEILPSRIIIFNGKEDLSQEFIGHSFSKSLPFLHLPDISSLPEGFDARAVLFGAATQMGFEVLEQDIPLERRIEDKTKDTNQEAQEETKINSQTLSAEDFGFIKDKDIAKLHEEKKTHKPESFQNKTIEAKISDEPPQEELISKSASPKNNFLTKTKLFLFHILRTIKKTGIRKPLSFFSYIAKGKMKILIPIVLFLIITVSSYFLFVSATITITIDPKITEQNQNITFSTTSQSQPNKNLIRGEYATISVDGTVSTPTTGKKDVGTKAKGTITIFNSLSVSKTISQGSLVKSPNNLGFTLDQSLTIKGVASHSADETVSPEKATASVIAQELGKEYNLPSGTKFSIASFNTTDLVAKNDNPFSGGTKKEITVVSTKDVDKLEEDLPKQLENQARKDLSKKLDKDKILLPVFTKASLTKKTTDVKIGEETEKLTLKGSVEYQGISYSKNDLVMVSRPLLEKDLSIDQKIDYNNIKTSVKDIKQKNDEEIEATLIIKALLLPKIDEDKLKKEIKGDSFKSTEDLLYKISQIANVDIVFSPNLPFLPKMLPVFERSIKIVILIGG